MYLSETEEIIAFLVCVAIVIGFAVSTYLEIKNTISEEKNKQKEKIENEAKIKTLIKYFDAKKNLIDRITETKRSLENRNK
tara:strand:+ start:278 stop:520 length:243 start_codon:yes stop_codon:yes gene_type:complete